MGENLEVSSTLKEVRQMIQDFLAPELRGIKVTLEAHGTAVAELRADLRELRGEVKSDAADLRAELKSDIAELRTELKSEMADLRAEVKSDIADLRAEVTELRKDMKNGFERLDRSLKTYEDVQLLKEEMAELRGERRARRTDPAA